MSDPAPARRRSPSRLVQVARVQTLSPAMRRITLTSPALADFPAHLPASYIKLIFPEAGQNEPAFPMPDGPRSTNMRTYTPLHVDAQATTLDVDFVLQGACTWLARLAPCGVSAVCWSMSLGSRGNRWWGAATGSSAWVTIRTMITGKMPERMVK